jgi:hypothetical protein
VTFPARFSEDQPVRAVLEHEDLGALRHNKQEVREQTGPVPPAS